MTLLWLFPTGMDWFLPLFSEIEIHETFHPTNEK
jgi:hypothetical protein